MGADDRHGDFLIRDHEPAYLRLHREGRLSARATAARALLAGCEACPRRCGVDRSAGAVGICRTAGAARVASAGPHPGEEAVLSGRRGSGTIFFAQCNLRCVFCQNHDISQLRSAGEPMDAAAIAGVMLRLQDWGCHNVNLVSPSHVVPQLVEAIAEAALRGLELPIVYNSNGYDCPASLDLLDGLVDVYMPDLKFWSPATARRYGRAADYPERAREAILAMHRQVGDLRLGPDGLARRGLLVRHLVMPGLAGESAAILAWLAREVSPDTYVNVMGQYRPAHRVGRPLPGGGRRFAGIDRRPAPQELAAAAAAARAAGLWRLV